MPNQIKSFEFTLFPAHNALKGQFEVAKCLNFRIRIEKSEIEMGIYSDLLAQAGWTLREVEEILPNDTDEIRSVKPRYDF